MCFCLLRAYINFRCLGTHHHWYLCSAVGIMCFLMTISLSICMPRAFVSTFSECMQDDRPMHLSVVYKSLRQDHLWWMAFLAGCKRTMTVLVETRKTIVRTWASRAIAESCSGEARRLLLPLLWNRTLNRACQLNSIFRCTCLISALQNL